MNDQKPFIDCTALLKRYSPSGKSYQIVYDHSVQVWEKADALVKSRQLKVDGQLLKEGALLHDIGSLYFVECWNQGVQVPKEAYFLHYVLGGLILRSEGLEAHAQIAETHAAFDARMVEKYHLPMPIQDYFPQTLEEKLVYWADKYYSKSGKVRETKGVIDNMRTWDFDAYKYFAKVHQELTGEDITGLV